MPDQQFPEKSEAPRWRVDIRHEYRKPISEYLAFLHLDEKDIPQAINSLLGFGLQHWRENRNTEFRSTHVPGQDR